MPFIDEREQALQILRRYDKLESNRTFGLTMLICLFMPLHLYFQKSPLDWYILVGGMIIWLRIHYVTRITRREFLTQMTPDELDLLARTSTVGFQGSDKRAAKGLLKAYHKIYPEHEYLRPSQQTQDETLLRAATHTDTTPQEQLLRPSPTEEG